DAISDQRERALLLYRRSCRLRWVVARSESEESTLVISLLVGFQLLAPAVTLVVIIIVLPGGLFNIIVEVRALNHPGDVHADMVKHGPSLRIVVHMLHADT